MKRLFAGFACLCVFALQTCFAGTSYVIATDNNPSANSAFVYALNTANGDLTLLKELQTGGQGLGGGSIDNITQAVTQTAACFFAMDTGSSDIAAFSKATGYRKVGNYSNSALNSEYVGGSIAVTPNGKWLYGAYSGSQNVGAWQVNSDCSLTFVAAYVPSVGTDLYSTLGVTPNGLALIVPAPDYEAAEAFKINANGTLSDIGFVSWTSNPTCASVACFPSAIDITKDGKVVVFGDSNLGTPAVLTANLTSKGLTNPQVWSLPNSVNVGGGEGFPFFSAAGYSGSGYLYVGISGFPPQLPGVTTVSFTESPLDLKVANTTVVESSSMVDAAIAATGNTMVILEPPNVIGVFRINTDGSITPLTTTESNASSLSIYPNTR